MKEQIGAHTDYGGNNWAIKAKMFRFFANLAYSLIFGSNKPVNYLLLK